MHYMSVVTFLGYLEDKCILIELYEYKQFPRTDS